MSSLDLPYREREINGTLYRATTLMLNDWAALTESLAQLLGEPIGSLLRGDAVLQGKLQRFDVESIIVGIVGSLSRQKILDLVAHMGKGLRAGDHLLTSAAQSMWWPRHMKDLAQVVGLFLEAQYADFFEGLSESLPLEQRNEGDHLPKESG